ncbi:MAG: PINc/VapC family ATPase [Nanoarchaeota archaeon]|nr:PINc/VapC family ATPase [Nanoarchaeota archaeon]
MKTYVVDTSVVIEKAVSKMIREKKIQGKILVPHAVVSELEAQANRGQEIGFLGLDELQTLQQLQGKELVIEYIGERPDEHQIKYAKAGEIDAYIRNIAKQHGAILITGDKVQAESAKAFGLEVIHLQLRIVKETLQIESYFDEHTMSVHIKEGCLVTAKKGLPGNWKLEQITKEPLNAEQIEAMTKELYEKTRMRDGSFIEISRKSSTIVQHKNYRIVIVRPPVSDGWEITIVRPIKKLDINDYNLEPNVKERLDKGARGVIIAGEVGSGKSTFAQALGEYYANQGKIVKTVESPRDLQLKDEITQYSKNFADSEEIHDILFLSRPDYIIYDEIRDTPDFELYKDLRLGGSNVLGVLHAAEPIDAVQRCVGRYETGMIPSVLDTIIYIAKGKIVKILTLKMSVKVPSGMTESDLARPVVEVKDFQTQEPEFEIYSYGEETIVIPVQPIATQQQGMHHLAGQSIKRYFEKIVQDADVEVISNDRAVVSIPEDEIARIIGKGGKHIEEIEKHLGISIEIKAFEAEKKTVQADVKDDGKNVVIFTEPGMQVQVHVDGRMLMTAFSSKKGEVKIHKKSAVGRELLKALDKGKQIEVKM